MSENNSTCNNCGNTAENDTTPLPAKTALAHQVPTGWGDIRIITAKGILTNGLICDGCLKVVQDGLKAVRESGLGYLGLPTPTEAKPYDESGFFEWVTPNTLRAGETQINFENLSQVDMANLHDIYDDGDTPQFVKDDIVSTGEKFSDCEAGEFPNLIQNAWNKEFLQSVKETDAAYLEHEAEIDAIKQQELEDQADKARWDAQNAENNDGETELDVAVQAADQLSPEALQEAAKETEEMNAYDKADLNNQQNDEVESDEAARDAAPVPAERDIAKDAAPVQVSKPTPKRTNNNRRRTTS